LNHVQHFSKSIHCEFRSATFPAWIQEHITSHIYPGWWEKKTICEYGVSTTPGPDA
jgi:hypothetical protein